jgi:hypothetical protein
MLHPEPLLRILHRDRRVLLVGAPGSGKSTLAAALADGLGAVGRVCRCISADPGTPAFGPPGALALGERADGGWLTLALEPLCTHGCATADGLCCSTWVMASGCPRTWPTR